jgi:hypothetical protein
MKAYVRIAELRSAEICELCGDNGKLRTELMWRKTLCDGCYPEKSGYNRNSKSEQKDVI